MPSDNLCSYGQRMADDRPTPADPTPHLAAAKRNGARQRDLPPELDPGSIAVLSGATFMYSDPVGDIPVGSIGGLVHLDTRLLNRWMLTVNGAPLLVLRSGTVDHYSAEFYLANPELPDLPADALTVRRRRYLGDGVHERIELHYSATEPVRVELRLGVGSDFADLLEIKSGVRERAEAIARRHRADSGRLLFRYENGDFVAQTEVHASPVPDRVDGDDFVWVLELPAGGDWCVDLKVSLPPGMGVVEPVRGDFEDVFRHSAVDPAARWRSVVGRFSSDSNLFEQVVEQTLTDLVALRLEAEMNGQRVALPAAGLPWFLTFFGRDTLITAYQTLLGGPRLAKGALVALAGLQGRKVDDFTDEEPGKILHEVRNGELTRTGQRPYGPYYGTADATQLWLILLSEYWRFTHDDELVRSLRPNALAALEWIDRYGDRDGDGYVEYLTRSPEGLGNQCWRDSWDGVRFSDGRLPVLPIATCEIQGYTYDAKLRLAELSEGPLDDPDLARRLRADAERLRAAFNRDFWVEERGGYYAVGIDGDKNRIDSITSNMGHLLWSGIVPEERAGQAVRQLMADSMFSGWGIRTLSMDEAAYNPIGYHLGTVWPHDNSIAALGMARYGYREEANRVCLALLEAAKAFSFRLPEAIAGYQRGRSTWPVQYPTACSPQAWAAGAPLNFLRCMLGLDAIGGKLVVDPQVPKEIGRIMISGARAFGRHWDIEAVGSTGYVRLAEP